MMYKMYADGIVWEIRFPCRFFLSDYTNMVLAPCHKGNQRKIGAKKLKCTLCQVQKVCVLVNIAIFIWIVLLAALSYPFAYPAVGVKVTAGEAEPMP